MFCWQCEWTKNNTGCLNYGSCGKSPEVAALNDLLLLETKRLGQAAYEARSLTSLTDPPRLAADRFWLKSLYATLSNVNFDPQSLAQLIDEAINLRAELSGEAPLHLSLEDKIALGAQNPINDLESPQILSLRETTLYGLKGLAAYAYHAGKLGREDEDIFALGEKVLALSLDQSLSANDWLNLALEVGRLNLRAMELLDLGHNDLYGTPSPTLVPLGSKKGPAILVSGHDLHDLAQLIEDAKRQGVLVYTHGETLPAHGYPALRTGLAGHFGTAWQNQTQELAHFPGPIIFTSNCLQKPSPSYQERVFVINPVGWPGAREIKEINGRWDFGPALAEALAIGGFAKDKELGYFSVGWGWRSVLGAADKIKELVLKGRIRRFLLVGGCDGLGAGRSYYRELVTQAPKDTIILTLGCGKFRFNDLDLGEIEGIPRLLDLGQCQDAFSAIKIASALSEVFQTPINDLPLSLILSWHEQKACAILLSLLYLGLKNIRLGPKPPAFIHPDIFKVLAEGYNLQLTTTAEADLQAIFG
ncbi:MAG: hydroxylamine reductase [Deltaproteobacteria bacterium]|jgi:hydroxylamine reductase|nr:hydroxylamine reductase [Deltaproteobacteria bacterium]